MVQKWCEFSRNCPLNYTVCSFPGLAYAFPSPRTSSNLFFSLQHIGKLMFSFSIPSIFPFLPMKFHPSPSVPCLTHTHSLFLLKAWGYGGGVGSISVLQLMQRASHSNLRSISVYKELRVEKRKHQKGQLHLSHWVGRLLSLCEANAS